MYNIFFFFLYKLHRSFLHFSFFIPSGKDRRSLCGLSSCLGYLKFILKMYPMLLYLLLFLIKSSSNLNISFFHSKQSRNNFLQNYQSIQIVQVPVHEIWQLFLWFIIFHESVICFCMLMNGMIAWIASRLRCFSVLVVTYHHLSIVPILILSFSSMLAMLILVLKENG